MSPILLKIIGLIFIIMGCWGLFAGKVMAGSRGLQPNYYTKQESPILYYFFIGIYFLIGILISYNSF